MKKAKKAQARPSSYRTLLTGDRVREMDHSVELLPPLTQCPGKWALIDLEVGRLFGWSDEGCVYVDLPVKVESALSLALCKMRTDHALSAGKKSGK